MLTVGEAVSSSSAGSKGGSTADPKSGANAVVAAAAAPVRFDSATRIRLQQEAAKQQYASSYEYGRTPTVSGVQRNPFPMAGPPAAGPISAGPALPPHMELAASAGVQAGPLPPPPVSHQQQQQIQQQQTQAPQGESAAAGPQPKKPDSKRYLMAAGGEVWEDRSLSDWPEDDFRIFVGDLGNDVTTELLEGAFKQYASFQKALVVRNKTTNKSKGFGFVSFGSVRDFMAALKDMNGKYIGNRPCKLRKGTWKERLQNQRGRGRGRGGSRGGHRGGRGGNAAAGRGSAGSRVTGVKRAHEESIFE
jgi:RNA recognition motif